MRRALIALAILAGAAPAMGADGGARIIGEAQAIDGDTLDLGAVRVRLFGIDAPEGGQSCRRADGAEWDCAAAASDRLAELIEGREVECSVVDRDRYRRVVATCLVGGLDLGEALVRDGYAWAYRRYSGRYVGAEAAARAARRGIWQGPAIPPWRWRALRRDRS